MGNAISGYTSLFGFILIIIGFIVAYASVGMVNQTSFGSDYSALSNSAMMLLLGAMLGVAGVMILLLSFLSGKREIRRLYYFRVDFQSKI
jgi:hypothetical protein